MDRPDKSENICLFSAPIFQHNAGAEELELKIENRYSMYRNKNKILSKNSAPILSHQTIF